MLTYAEAIGQGLVQAMAADESIYVLGAGVADPKGIFGTTKVAHDRWPARVIETPLSENMLTGACLGMALEGLRPVLVHARNDFLMLTMDQLVNNIAKWQYMSGGKVAKLPIVIRALIGRGWGQGPQHSQALHAMFAHIPGLRVVMPVFGRDAKSMLAGALRRDEPTIFLESRRLYDTQDSRWQWIYQGSRVETSGRDCTVVAIGAAAMDAWDACCILAAQDIRVGLHIPEVLKPLNISSILTSISRTGRLVVIDHAYPFCGLAGEIIAQCAEQGLTWRSPPVRMTCPDYPCGSAQSYEQAYYPTTEAIVKKVCALLNVEPIDIGSMVKDGESSFRGPF